MSETTYALLGYFGILVLLVFYILIPLKRIIQKQASDDNEEQNDTAIKRTGKLLPKVDYIEEYGVIDLDRHEILHSDFFSIILDKVPKIENDIEQSKLFYDIVKRLQPYSMKELFKVVQYLRDHPNDSPEIHRAYKSHITASAIVYDFLIPKALFNDDTIVLTYVAAHMRLHTPVSVFDEVQNYIRQEPTEVSGAQIVQEHKEIERFVVDMSFANYFLSMVFDHEAFLSIEYLYGRWLEQPNVNAFNQAFYKEDINHFKKLVTIYFGIFEIDVPKEYLYFNTAVCEYILQIRRYDPNKRVVKVVE